MKVQIYTYNERKIDNLNAFTLYAKFWTKHQSSQNRIMFSHGLKLYSKNFDCSHNRLKKLISIAKKMNTGTIITRII